MISVKLQSMIPGLIRSMRDNAQRAVKVTVLNIQSDARRMMASEQKHGRYYKRPGGKTHIASKPGEAPAVDTGNLLNSVLIEFELNGLTGYTYVIPEYGLILELGGARVAARPFMKPAAEGQRRAFISRLNGVFD